MTAAREAVAELQGVVTLLRTMAAGLPALRGGDQLHGAADTVAAASLQLLERVAFLEGQKESIERVVSGLEEQSRYWQGKALGRLAT